MKVWEFQARNEIRDIAMTKSGELVAAGTADGSIILIGKDGKPIWQKETGSPITKLKMSLDGGYIAVTTLDNKVHLYDRAGNALWKMGLKQSINGLSINSTGSSVVMGSDNMNTYTLDRTGKVLWGAKMTGAVRDVAISSNGNYIVAGSDDHSVYLLDIGGRLVWNYRTEGPIICVAISDNGDYLMASSVDKRIYFFDRSGAIVWNPRNTDTAHAMDLSISARNMVIGMGNEVHMLTREGALLRRWQGRERILDVAISANGEYAAAASLDDSIYYFDKNCELLWSHKTLGDVTCVAISSAGEFLVAGGRDRTIYYFDNNLYFQNFMAQAAKTLETVKGFGANMLEADVLMQRAESEFARKEYGSALNYARGAEKVALRLKEKCRPELSILAVASESFNLETQTKLNMILMNSGSAHSVNLRLEWAGQIALEGNNKIPSLGMSRFVSETYGIRPLATGTLPMKLSVFYCDNDGKEFVVEAGFSIVAGEAGKKVAYGKTQPIIQMGNIQRLVAKVQAAKKDAPAKAAAAAVPSPKAPAAGPAPGSFIADARCPTCGKGVRMEWPSCPYCHTKFRA